VQAHPPIQLSPFCRYCHYLSSKLSPISSSTHQITTSPAPICSLPHARPFHRVTILNIAALLQFAAELSNITVDHSLSGRSVSTKINATQLVGASPPLLLSCPICPALHHLHHSPAASNHVHVADHISLQTTSRSNVLTTTALRHPLHRLSKLSYCCCFHTAASPFQCHPPRATSRVNKLSRNTAATLLPEKATANHTASDPHCVSVRCCHRRLLPPGQVLSATRCRLTLRRHIMLPRLFFLVKQLVV